MIDYKKLVPKDKEDMNFAENLALVDITQIPKDVIRELLRWIQDTNWEQSRVILLYLANSINSIESEIIEILKGNDAEWKSSVLWGLILHAPVRPNNTVLEVIEDLALNPSDLDIEDGVERIASKIVEKYKSNKDI